MGESRETVFFRAGRRDEGGAPGFGLRTIILRALGSSQGAAGEDRRSYVPDIGT